MRRPAFFLILTGILLFGFGMVVAYQGAGPREIPRSPPRVSPTTMDPDTLPDLLIAVLASLALVGVPGLILTLAVAG